MSSRINWDALGVGASLACAIHCALLPLVMTSLPLFGVNIIHNLYFESGMILLALIVGITALWHGFRKHHHSLVPILLFCAGFAFLVAKQFWHQWELWLLIPGVTGIVSAHLLNYRTCRVHNHAHTDDCDH